MTTSSASSNLTIYSLFILNPVEGQTTHYSLMKKDIHPTLHPAKITCTSCGAKFEIPCTEKEISIEVCSQCHPIYTGKYRAATSSGRVERFQKKFGGKYFQKDKAKPAATATGDK